MNAQSWPSDGYLAGLQGDFNDRMRDSDPNHVDVTFRAFGGGETPSEPREWGIGVYPDNPDKEKPSAAMAWARQYGFNDVILFEKQISDYYFDGLDLSNVSDDALRELLLLLLMHEFLHTTPCTPGDEGHPGGKDIPEEPAPGENAPCAHLEQGLGDLETTCNRIGEIKESTEYDVATKCEIITVLCNLYEMDRSGLNRTKPDHNCPNLPPGVPDDPDNPDDPPWQLAPDGCLDCVLAISELVCGNFSGGPEVDYVPLGGSLDQNYFNPLGE